MIGSELDSEYYKNSLIKNPTGPTGGSKFVFRDGGWMGGIAERNAANQGGDGYRASIGFRCVSGWDITSADFTTLLLTGKKVLNLADTSVSQIALEAKPNKLPASINATAEVTIALYNPEDNVGQRRHS